MKKNLTVLVLIALIKIMGYSQNVEYLPLESEYNPQLKEHVNKYSKKQSPAGDNLKSGQADFGDPPPFQWVKVFENSSADYGLDINNDSEGNIYVCGQYSGNLDFFGVEVNTVSRREGFVGKFDIDGNLLWHKKISGTPESDISINDMKIDGNNDIYITGYFDTDNLTIGNTIHGLTGKTDLFVAKLDKDGNFIWSRTYGEAGIAIKGNEIICNDSELFIRTGNELMKMDKNGNIQWFKSFPGNSSFGLTQSAIIVTGSFNNSVIFGDGTVLWPDNTSGYNYGIYILKLDGNGNIINSKTWSCKGPSGFGSISINEMEEINISGYFNKEIKLDYTNIVFINEGSNFPCALTVMMSSDLGLIWHLKSDVNNTFINNTVINNDLIYMEGSYADSVSFNDLSLTGKDYFLLKMKMDGTIVSLNNLNNYNREFSFYSDKIFNVGYNSNYWDISLFKTDLIGTTEWIKTSTGDGGSSDIWYTMDTDQAENIYIQGNFDGIVNFDDIKIQGHGVYVAKLLPDGTPIWVNAFNGDDVVSSGLKTDIAGNVYAWGTYSGDLHSETDTISSNEGKGIYFLKFDNAGNLKFMKSFNGKGTIIGTGGIDIDNENNIIITGVFTSEISFSGTSFTSAGGNDGFLIKLDSNGNVIWARQQKSQGTVWSRSVGTDAQNNIYLTGGFNFNPLTLDNIILRPDSIFLENSYYYYGLFTCFTAKYDPDGNIIWAKKAGNGNYYDRGHAISVTDEGNAYVTGLMWNYFSEDSRIRFGDLEIIGDLNSYSDLFLAKYNTLGQEQWAKLIKINNYSWPAYQIRLDKNENIYIGGLYLDLIEIDGIVVNPSYAGATDLFLAKYTSNGDFQWLKTIEVSKETGSTHLSTVVVLAEDKCLLGGRLYGTSSWFNDIEINVSGSNGFLALVDDGQTHSLPGEIKGFEVNVYPNPASKDLMIITDQKSELFIYSIKGNVLFQRSLNPGENKFDISSVKEGTYILMIKNPGVSHIQKIVIM